MFKLALSPTGEVKSTKKYKVWAQKVASTPKPTTDPLAAPTKSKRGKQKVDDSKSLVAAIKGKVSESVGQCKMCVTEGFFDGRKDL